MDNAPPRPSAEKNFFVIACRVLWREICYFASQSVNRFDFNFVRQGLHDKPETLTIELQAAIDAVEGEHEALLIGYGLCSNGLAGITARDKPLVIMRGHDCITFLLGSKERYQEYFDNHPGTYWYSPGWIDEVSMPGQDRYEESLQIYIEKYGEDNAQYLMEFEQSWIKNYSMAAYVDLGFYDTTQYKDYTRQCAEYLQWECDILKGDAGLMRDFLGGHWDDERFLIVPPGETIKATHDAAIMGVKAAEVVKGIAAD